MGRWGRYSGLYIRGKRDIPDQARLIIWNENVPHGLWENNEDIYQAGMHQVDSADRIYFVSKPFELCTSHRHCCSSTTVATMVQMLSSMPSTGWTALSSGEKERFQHCSKKGRCSKCLVKLVLWVFFTILSSLCTVPRTGGQHLHRKRLVACATPLTANCRTAMPVTSELGSRIMSPR